MSLSASEQQALDSIEATLTSSDPKLAALLAIFVRLASGEEMPVREAMHKGAQPGRIGRATWPAGTSCLEGVGRQGRGETEHTSGY